MGEDTYFFFCFLSALKGDHEPLLPDDYAAGLYLNKGMFWLNHLPLFFMLFLLSRGGTSCHQAALNPGNLTSFDVTVVRKTVGLFMKFTTSLKVCKATKQINY